MKKHTLVTSVLNIFVVGTALAAWLEETEGEVTALAIASLLGAIAFGLMWVHYVADAIAPRQEDDSPDVQYYVSRVAVLVAILAHPALVNWHLLDNGFGLPPESYEKLVGSLAWAVLLGWMALAAFLLFEVRTHRLVARYERHIFHFNIAAMFLVLIHGFLIGMVMMNSWYVWVWWLLLAVFAVVAVYRYKVYYRDSPKRRLIAWTIVGAFTVAGILAGFTTVEATQSATEEVVATQNSSTESNNPDTTQTVISQQQLASSDGLSGNKCWVAIDGVVYDVGVSDEWQNGRHIPSNGMAQCGQDLTQVLSSSPHGRSVLSDVPEIGTLEQ